MERSEGRASILSFRDLHVWQAGMDLVERVYLVTSSFPSSETYGLAGQMRRAAVSVPSNIAEGHTRLHSAEFVQHLSVAQASLAELVTQLEIAGRLNYLPVSELKPAMSEATSLAKQLYALRNALIRKDKPKPKM